MTEERSLIDKIREYHQAVNPEHKQRLIAASSLGEVSGQTPLESNFSVSYMG